MGGVDVEDLYGLPLDQFVPERTALVRELRKAGKREEAAEVAALRKPSVAAWAVNQLVRTQRKAVTVLLDAGDALRSAQDDVLAGAGDARSLRTAVERERAAVDALTEAARGLLSSDGDELSDAILARVADTLHAGALDDDAREQLNKGCIERELRHVGLGTALAGGTSTPSPARGGGTRTPATARAASKKSSTGGSKPGGGAKAPARDRAAERAARAEHERAERERAQARTEARAVEREARRRAERAARAVQLARERRDKAAEALREAEDGLKAAEAEVRALEDTVAEAEAAVREASR
jgi:hypothetical protein